MIDLFDKATFGIKMMMIGVSLLGMTFVIGSMFSDETGIVLPRAFIPLLIGRFIATIILLFGLGYTAYSLGFIEFVKRSLSNIQFQPISNSHIIVIILLFISIFLVFKHKK